MSFEEEFDKIIRQKSEEVEYPFDEKNWEQARSWIDSDRKAARALKLKRLLKPALALTIFGSAVLVTFMYVNSQTASENIGTSQVLEKRTETNNAPLLLNTVSDKAASSPAVAAQLEEQKTSSHNLPKSMSNEKFIEQTSKPTTNQLSTITSETDTSENSSPENTDVKEENITPLSKPSSGINGDDAMVVSSAALAGIGSENSSGTSIKNEEETTSVKESEQKSEEVFATTAAETNISTDYLNTYVLTLPQERKEETINGGNLMIVQMKDDDYFKQKRKTHYFNVEAGLAYLTGWNTNNDKDGVGVNYFGGINYGIYLNNKLSIGIGAQAYNVSNINQPYYSSSHKIYDFGSATIYTVVTCTQLYYAAIPFKINYSLNRSNTIGLGFNAAYAYNAYVNTESYTYLDNEKVLLLGSAGKGIYEGMNQYNYMLTAHYSLRFGKRIGLNAEVVYGLTDLFKNTSDINTTEKSTGIRLSLNYTIFDK